MWSSKTSGSGIFPLPTAWQAKRPLSGGIMEKPYFSKAARLSWVMGFSSIAVFMAGATSFLQRAARTTVVSMSSAMPWASLAMTSAVAGATKIRSAAVARETWAMSY